MNKYLALQGEKFDISKVTVVGSPTITSKGVASGFSESNYLRGATGITLGNNFKIQAEFTTGDDVTSYQGILRMQSTTGFLCSISNRPNGSRLVFGIFDNNDISVIPVMKTNTEYKFLIECRNGLLTTYYSENNSNLIKVSEVENINITHANTLLTLGNNTNSYFWQGSIDLTAFKIYVDGQLVFQPVKPTYLLERRKPKVWNKEQFTVVGNPSISDDGVASGFSNNDYIVPTSLTLEQLKGKSWSYSFKCTIPDTSASSKYIISFANNLFPSLVGGIKFEGYGIYLGGKYGTTEDSTNELWKLIGTYSRPADVGKEVLITASFNIETGEYNAKAILDNKELNMTPYTPPTANKELYYINTNSSSKAFRVLVGNDKFYLKSIKIYTDNTLAFDGGADTYVYDPSKFTVLGTPTITEYGVASGFSASDYLNISDFIINSKTWEIKCKFNTNDFSTAQSVFGFSNSYWANTCSINTSKNIRFFLAVGSNSTVVKNLGADKCYISAGVDNYLYIKFDGNKYEIGISQDGINYNTDSYISSETLYIHSSSVSRYIQIGKYGGQANTPFLGSIDLTQFSITVDGKEVFTGAKENYYMLRR